MTAIETLLVALSTYSTLPVPQFEWKERNMRWAICCFPAVGLLCGGGLALWVWLCRTLAADAVLFAAGAVCLPLLVTGGIHMDGFMDTVDALASHQPRARKLEIMKDSACGAFAVLYCGVYLLLSFGLYHGVYRAGNAALLAPTFVLSRALSALCAVTMPNARRAGMLCAFTEKAHKTRAAGAMALLAALTGGGMVWLSPVCGGAAAVCVLVSLTWYRTMAKKRFGGATGDTAGFFLQVCELSMLFGFWLGGTV